MRVRWWMIVGLAVVGVLVWFTHRAHSPSGGARVEGSPASRSVATPRPSAPSGPPLRRARERASKALPFDASARHTADPCTELVEPVIPAGFEQITEGTITVAWDPAELEGPFDAPLRPVALAHAVTGMLEEAAQLTGTTRRDRLTVIVDGSLEDLQLRTRTPAWVRGLYDGGAVHVPASPSADLGVVLGTLRHELMHAQIHAAVGCVPFWFNEGLATYFAGTIPMQQWMAMLRTREPFDLERLRDPAVLDLRSESAERMYAVALAMIVYIVHQKGEVGLREAVRLAQTIENPHDLWDLVHADVDDRAILGSLAREVFDLPPGPELDAVLRGAVCCRNLKRPAELACHAPDPERAPDPEPVVRRAICRRW